MFAGLVVYWIGGLLDWWLFTGLVVYWIGCLLDWMRLASSKARGLENGQVPCSAGETPAIHQFVAFPASADETPAIHQFVAFPASAGETPA
ncbi:MAG: hypothetical protein PHR27_10310, partial [Candidatus Cloacimonetes bacterium]|nr:hypothetical protein [Candidatus Cloacimonadota bacterium]